MRRSWHVVQRIGKEDLVLKSYDTYEQAKECALFLFRTGKDNEQFQIHNSGAIVWGPYIVGGKYNPS